MESSIVLPTGFDWQHWFSRWERMQERYLVAREERFDTMLRLIRASQPQVARILDLGCGPGSLMLRLLEQFPHAEVVGVDFDPTLLVLAQAQLAEFGDRATFIRADLREPSWVDQWSAPFDAVVSATALHWLTGQQLSLLYRRAAQVVRPGGIFLNADHVGSEFQPLQDEWERHADELLAQVAQGAADDWSGFWNAYGHALNVDIAKIHQVAWDAQGVEEGMPLAWHFHQLKASGFRYVDCFWRRDGDAIYGGMSENFK
ncbi:MAG: class I SAM-dependent methyltransferase [Chloroflexi bacterium]|nr:class I SAM-dependent methyltransferase [Chloroflexota bacterium]